MTKRKCITGHLLFYDDVPHCVGELIIDGEQYQLAGVRKSRVRTDFKANKDRSRSGEKQRDLFEEE
jgi:hypothetical protein